MTDLLIQQGLYVTLVDKKATDIEESKYNEGLYVTIRLALAPKIKYNVLELNSPNILWEQLAETYRSKSLAKSYF